MCRLFPTCPGFERVGWGGLERPQKFHGSGPASYHPTIQTAPSRPNQLMENKPRHCLSSSREPEGRERSTLGKVSVHSEASGDNWNFLVRHGGTQPARAWSHTFIISTEHYSRGVLLNKARQPTVYGKIQAPFALGLSNYSPVCSRVTFSGQPRGIVAVISNLGISFF